VTNNTINPKRKNHIIKKTHPLKRIKENTPLLVKKINVNERVVVLKNQRVKLTKKRYGN